jgi:hypothetical protein
VHVCGMLDGEVGSLSSELLDLDGGGTTAA